MKFQQAKKLCDWGYLHWNDPDPIEGNNYKVVSIIKNGPGMAIIQYNGGESEAEIFINELTVKTN